MLATIRKVFGLGGEERALLAEACVDLWRMRIGLWLVPFRWLYRAPRVARRSGPAPEQIARAVSRGSRLVPWPTCLVRALAARRLLARHGVASELCLGVARPAFGRFEAHAWLECGGVTILGGEGAGAQYSTLKAKVIER